MEGTKANFSDLINQRNVMLQQQHKLYLSSINNLNMRTRELLKDDFGSILVKNVANDIAGEIVRKYFDTSDYYITVDQMYRRITKFSYDNEELNSDENIRKSVYNFNDFKDSKTHKEIIKSCDKAQRKIFEENRKGDNVTKRATKQYRKSREDANGNLRDDLTGANDGRAKHADHIQSRQVASYNERYTKSETVEELRTFYNSSDNFQIMDAVANTSKGDVRVCNIDGKIEYLNTKDSNYDPKNDITHRATPEQLTEATVQQLEKDTKSSNKKSSLKEAGYLDENGKVKASVRKELEAKFRKSQNKESMIILKGTKYDKVAGDALKETANSLDKIVAGQVIYYVLPPMIHEIRDMFRNRKNLTLDNFLTEIKKAGKRVIKYVTSKLHEILKNIFGNAFTKFVKVFFDIIIETVKATVKKMLSIVKQLVMSLVECVKTVIDKNASAAEKADAITKILAVAVTNVVIGLLSEYIEKQFGLPNFLMEPLQIIVSVISTNIVMLILQKADLFNIKYGLLTGNIDRLFKEEYESYMAKSADIFMESNEGTIKKINTITEEISQIQHSMQNMDVYKSDVTPELSRLSEMFDMKIDFNQEWNEFISIC